MPDNIHEDLPPMKLNAPLSFWRDNVELQVLRGPNYTKKTSDGVVSLTLTPLQKVAEEEVRAILDEIVSELKADETTDAEIMFKRAVASLDKVDRARFITQNLLEGVKRGESVGVQLARYKQLGLTNQTIQSPQATLQDQDGEVLRRIDSWVAKTATAIAQLAIGAFRLSSKFIGVKPVVGFTGMFPSLSFIIETKDASIDEILSIFIDKN